MRTRHIEIFRAAHRTGSLTKAAEVLCISQPAASKLLAHAEATLGFQLFERIKGRLHLTREGEMLVPAVDRVYRELEEVRRLARSLKVSPEGQLKVGCIPTLGLSVLPTTLALSRKAHPGISLNLTTAHSDQLAQALLTREISIAVVFNPRNYPGLRMIEVGQVDLLCYDSTSNPNPVRMQDLVLADVIGLPADDPVGSLIQSLLLGNNSSLNVQTYYVACALAQAGAGVAMIDELTARALLKPNQQARQLDPPISIAVCALIHENAVLSKIEKGFLERLTTVLSAS